VPAVTNFFLSTAQAPGGGAIGLAKATVMLGSATAAANNATFTTDIARMIIPQSKAKRQFYIVIKPAQAARSVALARPEALPDTAGMMDAVTETQKDSPVAALTQPRARVGLIIPSVNRLTEAQFNHYAPEGLGIHVARGRVAGEPARTVAQLADEIAHAAGTLADAKPDLIVFHCTHTSMKEGIGGEARIIELIRRTTGIEALSTSSLVNDALRALGLKTLVVLSPYMSNAGIIDYLAAAGFTVVKDVALRCKTTADFETVTPQRWLELAIENDTPEADGIFLSCTNTTQIEAVAAIEAALGKPVVNSNQAVLWGCLKRLKDKLGGEAALPANLAPNLGRLMKDLQA